MKSAVLIVNWNSGQRLRYCLKSLPATPATVVVDNASADDSIKLARDCAVPAKYIENRMNRGLAAGINQGFAETETPYVLLLNPDVRLPQGSAELLEEILDNDSRVGAVGGYVNENYLPRPIPTPWTLILENCGFPAAAMNPLGLQEVGQVAVAAMLVRREAYDQVKGFDDRFFPAWYEDVDFCNRLQAAGWKVCFDRQAQFVHEGGYSAEILGASDFLAAYYRNQIRYVNKYFSASAGLVRFSIALGIAARWLRARSRVAGCSRMITGALWDW